MKKKISSKLRILLCFGVIIFTALGLNPLSVSAHHQDAGNREPAKVYDFDEPWDANWVGWFTHDKEVSPNASGIWYDRQAYVTTYSVPGCYVPADAYLVRDFGQDGPYAPACTDSGMKDSFYLFKKMDIYYWASKAGATPDSDGTLHVWVQPAIGTKTKKNGQWVDDGVTLMSLNDWTKAKQWGNPSTFQSHYNKPLHIKLPTAPPGTPDTPDTPAGVTVKYQTLDGGDSYQGRQDIIQGGYYNFNIGSVHTYSDTGTSGLIVSNVEGSNLVYPGKQYDLRTDAMGDIGAHANNGYTFSRTHSDIYNFMAGQSFRSTFGTTITYLYAEVDSKSTVYPAMLFSGYDTLQLTGVSYTKSAGEKFEYAGGELVPQTKSYKNSIFELVRTAFYKVDGNNLLRKPFITNNLDNKYTTYEYNIKYTSCLTFSL